jgi:hypothetical protein
MTSVEIQEGIDLYNEMAKEHYGSMFYKSARNRFEKFIHKMSKKYNVEYIKVRNDILSNKKSDKKEKKI